MTRMLCSFLTAALCVFLLGGCTLFDSNEDTTAGQGQVLDAENELLSESGDLNEDSAEDAGDDALADVGSDEGIDENGLEGDLSTAALNDDSDQEVSATTPSKVDQNLADDELDDLNEASETAAASTDLGDDENFLDANVNETEEKDQFALDAEPPATETLTAPPVVAPLQDSFSVSSSQFGNEVINLEYKAFENGGTVVIETASPASYQLIEDTSLNQIVVQLDEVSLPEKFKRPYITKDFKQDIATINAYSDESTGAAKFVIQLKRPIKPIVQKEGSAILVMTGSGSPILAQNPEQPLNDLVSQNQMQRSGSDSFGPDSEAGFKSVTIGESQGSDLKNAFGNVDRTGVGLNNGSFTGDKINIEFTDTDIRTIIEMIAERSGVNLIMDDEVEGKTSVRLRNIPWDQALVVTLRSKALGYVKQGNVLRIAKQETLSKEAQAVSNQIKSEKEAQLLSGGIKVKYIPVSYANVNDLSAKLKPFLSKEGQIAFDDRTSSLVITDYGEYLERVLELVKALDTPPMQVEIAAKLIEAREQFIREAGINWDIAGADFPVNSQTGRLDSGIRGGMPTEGFTMDLAVGTFDILGDLSATLALFENQNKIKVLSQPRVVTMNKTKARIEQTTQIPIETIIQQPNQVPQITYTFQDLKLLLEVTPQITFKGDVILDVELRREFPGTLANNRQRELNKRLAKTTVMVKNGETSVIGGIYQMDDTDIDRGLPWLKDIPLIGYLFKQIRLDKSKNELLLFLKPKILKETDGNMISKSQIPDQFDPFEELSVDENSNKTDSVKSTSEDTTDESFDESDLDDGEGD